MAIRRNLGGFTSQRISEIVGAARDQIRGEQEPNVSTSHITGNAPQAGDRVPDPFFDCAECGQLEVTSDEECPSLSVPRGVGHRPRGRSVIASEREGGAS